MSLNNLPPMYVCIVLYVCMYVLYVCMYVLYVCMYVSMYVLYVCMYCMYVCMHVCMHVRISIFEYLVTHTLGAFVEEKHFIILCQTGVAEKIMNFVQGTIMCLLYFVR